MIENTSKCVIVFSGFNQRAVISFLRTLEKNNVQYAIIAIPNDLINKTEYKVKVHSIRGTIDLNLEDIIASIKSVQKKKFCEEYIIAPSTEALNRFILENRSHFEDLNCTIPIVENYLYNKISDKYSFAELCIKNDILVPKEIKLDKNISFPYVAKPKQYYSIKTGRALSPVIISDQQEHNNFISYYDFEDFYFQEFIGGRSLYLLYYFHRNGKVFKFSQENLIQQPNGKSIIAAITSDVHNSNESLKYENLFKSVNFCGLVMVEVKLFKNNYYMIEANPRFWGPSQLFVDAGVNFFECFLNDYSIIDSINESSQIQKARYFWFGGLIQVNFDNNKLVYYDYNSTELINDLPLWLSTDIYSRSDTIEIFKEETKFNEF